MAEEERSAEARAVAELALARLLAASAPTSEQLIVLGVGMSGSTIWRFATYS